MPEVNGKQPSEKVQRLLANWDIKKHQPYATHQSFVKLNEKVDKLIEMFKAVVDKK